MRFDPINAFYTHNPNSVYLHASAISISGKALLFLGHSNSGKSTISDLLSSRFPKIADDKVLVFWKNEWLVRGVSRDCFPWTPNGCVFDSKEYPILAVARIFQAAAIKITAISKRETCRHLVDSVFENDFQKNYQNLDQIKKWFSIVKSISEATVGYRLTFPKSKTIISEINNLFERRLS